MKPTHCFVRVRLNATSNTDGREMLSLEDFKFIMIKKEFFEEVAPGVWQIDIFFSYEDSEDVAEGDLEDDILSEFRRLLRAKNISNAEYEFHIVAGGCHPDPFKIKPHVVAAIAALGGSIYAHRSADCTAMEDAEAEASFLNP